MYDYLKGQLVETTHSYAVIDVQGIGFKVLIPTSLLGQLPLLGETTFLYVSWVVREMSQTFYGFGTKQQRDLFEVLITLSGVGPKTALALIGHFSIEDLEQIVQSGSFMQLAKVPGIGKKTAERLIVDLRGKLQITPSISTKSSSTVLDALSALVNLGYTQASAEKALKKATSELSEQSDVSQLITAALKLT